MLGLRYVACEECGRVTATAASDAECVCGRCESVAVRDLDGEDGRGGAGGRAVESGSEAARDRHDDGAVAYFASSMRPE
jgi:hypothetical protein